MVDRAPIIFACCILGIFGASAWGNVWKEKAHQRAEAYCEERQMLLVETPAGERCAHVWALERVGR